MSDAEERVWFCPQCGISGPEMTSVDEDGCCCVCGATACRESELRALLAKVGLHIVTEAEKRVLDACAAFPDEVLNQAEPIPSRLRGAVSDASYEWCEAELARRTP